MHGALTRRTLSKASDPPVSRVLQTGEPTSQPPVHHDFSQFAIAVPDRGDDLSPPPGGNESPIQRRVALARANKDTEDDWVILSNIHYALKMVGGGTSDLKTNDDYSNMGKDENLAIVGHGSAGKIQGYSASDIVTAITREGKEMPKTTRKVIVLACNAAKPTVAQDPSSSLISQMAQELREKNYGTIVEGKPSYAQTHEDVGERGTIPGKEKEHMKIEKPLIHKHGLSQGLGGPLVPASTLMSRASVDTTDMKLEDRAAWISGRTSGLYKELAEQTEKAGTIFPEAGAGAGSGTVLAHGTETLAQN